MPPEKHVFRAGDAASSGSLQKQGEKTVFRASDTKAGRGAKKPARPAPAPETPVPAAAPGAPAPKRAARRRAAAENKAPAPPARRSPPADFAKRRAARSRRLPLAVLGCLLALLLAGLAAWALDLPARLAGLTLPGGSSASAPAEIKDGQDWPAMVGDRLVEEKPQKLVSLSPMVTEALLSLPGHEALCAITEYCDGRSTDLPTVGTPLLPRVEEIIDLAPDYLLCQTALTEPVRTELEQAGVKILQLDTPADLDGLRRFYGQLGALLGGNETGRALGYGVIDRLADTLARYDTALPDKASALLLPDLSGLAATADTAEWALLGQVFRHPLPDAAGWLAGEACLADEDPENDLAAIRAADPDLLLISDAVSPDEVVAALGDLRAVQNGAVIYLDLRLAETLSPRLIFTIADGTALAYPELASAS